MNVVHLTDSPFFGGPERQILGLSRSLPAEVRTSVLCFRDNGTCAPFLAQLAEAGVGAAMLDHATPQYRMMIADVADSLRRDTADLLICHGYKADILGLLAARRVRVPVVSVSRGWTAHTRKVRLNEMLDRLALRFMDTVVCVSEGQAEKVRRAGVPAERVLVIRNAIDQQRFAEPDRAYRDVVQNFFPGGADGVVIAVGRLSPEKGFEHFVAAARKILADMPRTGFLVIGDGPSRLTLEEQVAAAGMSDRVILTGFRTDVDRILPHADVLAQSSFTEGLPNVVLEACAAGVPVVATAVGGTPEIVRDGWNGYLVAPGDTPAMEDRVLALLRSKELRMRMGEHGRDFVRTHFSFASQGAAYERLFARFSAQSARP